MARGTVLWSDKSGTQITPGTGARVRIMFYDDRVDMRGDLTDAEVKALVKEYKLKEVEPRPERRVRL